MFHVEHGHLYVAVQHEVVSRETMSKFWNLHISGII
jgi:hypothetical protein